MIQSSAQNHIFYDDVHGAQNHYFYGCEQCAKMGGAQPYTTYMCMCAPHLAGVGSRAEAKHDDHPPHRHRGHQT